MSISPAYIPVASLRVHSSSGGDVSESPKGGATGAAVTTGASVTVADGAGVTSTATSPARISKATTVDAFWKAEGRQIYGS